ncbi:MAG: endonuclease/exonuclease/phosphatase family protein [Myxococcota bacterium]
MTSAEPHRRRRQGDLFLSINAALIPAVALLLGGSIWAIDVLCSFSLHAAIVALILGLERLRLGRFVPAGFWMISVALWSASIPRLNRAPLSDGPPTLKLAVQNLLTSNRNFDQAIDAIRTEDPDVFCALEVDEGWLRALQAGLPDLTMVIARPRTDNFGIAIFTRDPNVQAQVVEGLEDHPPALMATVDGIRVFAVHTVPPISRARWEQRNRLLDAIRTRALNGDSPAIVAGDLNFSPSSPSWPALTEGLRRVQPGRIPWGTWPSRYGDAGIAIDHVLLTEGLDATAMTMLPPVGSDHRGLVVEVRKTP